MTTKLPKVVIGCPVRNRAWILPDYLGALEALEYPAGRLTYAFVVNDCTDDTVAVLEAFARRRPTTLIRLDLGHPRWQRGYYSYENLARLRNRLVDHVLASDAGYLFSVDSDILVPPEALTRLLAAGPAIIAARVPNDLHLGPPRNRCNFLRRGPQGHLTHVTDFPASAVISVDVAGAAILLSRQVLEAGCRYSAGYTGEDEGFCAAAQSLGFTIWVDTGVHCTHCMVQTP